MSQRIEFKQPNQRREDWRVLLNGRTVGSVWRAGEGRYLVSYSKQEEAPDPAKAFKLARKQLKHHLRLKVSGNRSGAPGRWSVPAVLTVTQ